ncbi:hypothetical protein BFP75_11435 [Maribacter sp. 4G9]|nr:hypothetical protein BFP75_11435 [Maribacter sp. 4G9]
MVFGVFLMALIIGYELVRFSRGEDMKLIYFVPTVLCPLFVVIPMLLSAFVSKEIKKREKEKA